MTCKGHLKERGGHRLVCAAKGGPRRKEPQVQSRGRDSLGLGKGMKGQEREKASHVIAGMAGRQWAVSAGEGLMSSDLCWCFFVCFLKLW